MSQPKTARARITSGDIMGAMTARFALPEWAIMWEVADSTGANVRRYADAVMMSLWPSRGLELHGVEIKVSAADWRREAQDPTKAELIARYCDRWWIHAAPDVVRDVSELPPAWGLREWDGTGWRTIREAEKTPAEPVTRHFLAAMLRRSDGTLQTLVREAQRRADVERDEEIARMRELRAREIESLVERRTREFERKLGPVRELQALAGEDCFSRWLSWKRFGRAALALECLANSGTLRERSEKLRAAAQALSTLADELDEPAAERTP